MICQGAGGGYGDVLERDPEAVMADVEAGYLSGETAREIYFVVYDPDTLAVDAAATQAARDAERQARLAARRPYREFVSEWVTRAARAPAVLRLVGRRQQRHPRHRLDHARAGAGGRADGPAAADLPARSERPRPGRSAGPDRRAGGQLRPAAGTGRSVSRLLASLDAPPSGRERPIWFDAADYGRAKLLAGGDGAVGFPGRARRVRRQAAGHVPFDAILVDVGGRVAQRAAADQQLRPRWPRAPGPVTPCARCSPTSRPARSGRGGPGSGRHERRRPVGPGGPGAWPVAGSGRATGRRRIRGRPMRPSRDSRDVQC